MKTSLAAALLCAAFPVLAAPLYPEPSRASADIAAGIEQASQEHKRVIVDFGGDWCTDCKVFDAYLKKPENAEILAKRFVLVHVNVGAKGIETNFDTAERFGIPLKKGVPALAVLDAKGAVLYAQKNGEFEAMRHMDPSSVHEFLVKWQGSTDGAEGRNEGPRRFALTPLDEMTPEQRAVAEAIRSGPRASVGSPAAAPGATSLSSPFNVWNRRPELADRLQKVGEYVRFRSSLPPRLNEFAILIVARTWSAQYEWFAHHRLAMAAGLDPAVAEDLKLGRRPANMKADEATVFDFVTELMDHHGVGDATYRRAIDAFGEQGAADLIAVSGYYVLVAMTVNVDRTPIPNGGEPPLPPL
jgi:4-carboxymuconolactone decarboxylase